MLRVNKSSPIYSCSNDFGQLNPVQRNLPRFIKLALNLSW